MAPRVGTPFVEDEGKDDKATSEMKVCERQHMISIIALSITILAHSYLLISVFPYSGYMAMDLIPSVTADTAGSYAGFIAAAFMLGRAVISVSWGKWADIYGRTTVMIMSLALSALFSLLFGLAPSFAWAIVFRTCLGLSNGLVGTIRTTITEIAQGDQKLETRGMGIVMGMWGFAFIFSPALGGALAEPVKQYPSNIFVHEYHDFLSMFPFILPNLLAILFCLIGIFFVYMFVPETLHSSKRRSYKMIPQDIISLLGSPFQKCLPQSSEHQSITLKETTYNSTNTIKNDAKAYDEETLTMKQSADDITSTAALSEKDTTIKTKTTVWQNPKTRRHLIMSWSFAFISVSFTEVFPLFCMSQAGGLGLSEGSIGKILSASGIIYALGQYVIFATIMDNFGLYTSIRIGCMISAPLILLVPLSIWINNDGTTGGDDTINWQTYLFLGFIVGFSRIFASLFFSAMSMAMNRTVSTSERATMNGVSMLGESVAKGLGPTFAGILVSFSVGSGVFLPHEGAVFTFAIIGGLGLLVTVGSFVYLEPSSQ